MYFTPNRHYSCRQAYDLIIDANNYIHSHCWGCDKSFNENEQMYQILGNVGLYCKDCHDRLTSALIIDSPETESNKDI